MGSSPLLLISVPARKIATEFMSSSSTISTRSPRRRVTNSRSASVVQAKIWIGSANESNSPDGLKRDSRADDQQRRRLADRAREREDHARRDAGDRARQDLLPDRLPLGRAERHRASRIDGGTARIASRATMITTGSTSSESVMPPASSTAHRQRPAHDEREPEDPVDHGGHRREVLDVDLDQPVEPLRGRRTPRGRPPWRRRAARRAPRRSPSGRASRRAPTGCRSARG